MPIPNLPFSILLNILKAGLRPLTKLKMKKRLEGYYLVYHQNSDAPVITSPDRIPNVLEMKISFWKPDVLKIKAKDFDKTYRNIWKTWEGKIIMDDESHGKGYYNYLENNEPGDHEIWIMKDGVIRVRVTDKGRANLKERRDNDPATQQWKKVARDHPQLATFKKMLDGH